MVVYGYVPVVLTGMINLYCSFIMTFDIIDDVEPEDNGPKYAAEYIGANLTIRTALMTITVAQIWKN